MFTEMKRNISAPVAVLMSPKIRAWTLNIKNINVNCVRIEKKGKISRILPILLSVVHMSVLPVVSET